MGYYFKVFLEKIQSLQEDECLRSGPRIQPAISTDWRPSNCFLTMHLYISIHTSRTLSYFLLTAICSLARPWEAILIGAIGALLACPGCALLDRLLIDDPVGCVPTHGFAGIWGLLCVALFAEKDILENKFSNEFGIFKGGPWRFLGVQILMVVAVSGWAAVTTLLELLLVDKIFGLRMSIEDELMGADKVEHGIAEHELTNQTNHDPKENGHEDIRPVEINVNELQARQGVGTLQRNENGDRCLWKTVRARRKLLRPKWRRTVSLESPPSDGSTNSTAFVMNGSYIDGGVSVNVEGVVEGDNHRDKQEKVR